MRIKEIELDNFKSFGKPTVVPILNGFTTISGPNGSGKSNIVDSLLFALGLSSTRTMRAERLPDLLNNLSGRNEAKVTVRFTNDAGTELEVSRRLRVKDNGYTSTYNLNGKVTTLTDIHDELTRYNVSPTGFNVIMQGDVTGIVSMSPTERRKIIDELAGVAEFDRRIEQAQKELITVAEKIDHQRIVLSEIDTRLEILQADRDVALKYLDLKNQKERIERDLVFIRVRELETKVDSERTEIGKLDKKEEELGEKREQSELETLSLRAEIGRIEEEIREKGGNEQLLIRQELENQRGKLTREENKLSNLSGVIGEKGKLQKSVLAQIKTIDKHLFDLSKEKKQHQADLEAVQKILGEKQGAYSAVNADIEVLRQAKDSATSKMLSLHTDLESLRDKKHQLEMRRTELMARKETLEKEIETIRTATTNSIGKTAGLKSLIGTMQRNCEDQQALVLGLARGVRQMEDELQGTNEDIEAKRVELEQVSRRLIELETHREVAGESGYGKAVETILAANMPGVFGTIGQLGRVDERYTVALEMAIGPRLSHIVVEDDEIAQKCIELLKKTKAGRATFVPLNKIQTQPPGLIPNRPGVIDFAYNLIDFEPRFTKAIQYACGQTVVMDTLDNARKLMGTGRLVTIEGELLEKYGTISGGIDHKNKLHFSAKANNDLSSLRLKSTNLVDDIKWLQDSLKELNASLAGDREKLNDQKTVQVQNEADLTAKKNELAAVEEEVEDLKPRLRASGDEIETVDTEVAAIDNTLKQVNKDLSKLQEKVAEVTGGATSPLDKLIAEAEDLKGDLDATEKSAAEIQRHIDRIVTEERVETGNRRTLQEQLDTINKEMDELNAQRPEFETKINELKKMIQELEKKSTDISDELKALNDEKAAVQEKITAVEIEKTKMEAQLEHLAEERAKRRQLLFELSEELIVKRQELEEVLAETPDYKPPAQGTVDQLLHQIERLEKRMRGMEPVNMKALEEYNETKQRKEELEVYLETLNTEKDEINQRIAGYDELKKNTFMEAFNAINANFKEIFAELSHGTGRLELEDPENPFEGGLIIRAQPREKKMQRIEALSGGEKSLTALSFVFAFQRYAPAPFYAFDEVDMMLDGANADRLARMVARQSEEAQFVVVSLRRPMIENADHAIGVSLRADGYSKVVGISDIKLPEEEAVGAR
jgi:chromosome segregation protein